MRLRVVDIVAVLALLVGVSAAVQSRIEVARLRAEVTEQRRLAERTSAHVRRWSRTISAVAETVSPEELQRWYDAVGEEDQ